MSGWKNGVARKRHHLRLRGDDPNLPNTCVSTSMKKSYIYCAHDAHHKRPRILRWWWIWWARERITRSLKIYEIFCKVQIVLSLVVASRYMCTKCSVHVHYTQQAGRGGKTWGGGCEENSTTMSLLFMPPRCLATSTLTMAKGKFFHLAPIHCEPRWEGLVVWILWDGNPNPLPEFPAACADVCLVGRETGAKLGKTTSIVSALLALGWSKNTVDGNHLSVHYVPPNSGSYHAGNHI